MKHIQSIYNDIPKTKGYDKCKQREKDLADAIYQKMAITSSSKLTFNLPKGCTGQRVIYALMVQHFPYTWQVGQWYTVEILSDKTRNLTIDAKTFKKLDKKNHEVRARIKEIVANCNIDDSMNDYTKAKILAIYLADHCEYRKKDDDLGYQAWDALCNNSAICCGYSEAYKALCDYCNIRCQCLTSYDHQWNRVKIGGKWLNVDVCWLAGGAAKSRYLLTDDKIFYSAHMEYVKAMPQYWKLKEY